MYDFNSTVCMLHLVHACSCKALYCFVTGPVAARAPGVAVDAALLARLRQPSQPAPHVV